MDLRKKRGKEEPLEVLHSIVSSWLENLSNYNRKMLSVFLLYKNKDRGIMASCSEAARLTEGNSECIRRWVKQAILMEDGNVDSNYFHHPSMLSHVKTPWLLDSEEELQQKARCYIRQNACVKGRPNMTAKSFTEWVNVELLPQLSYKQDPIHEDTGRWMNRLGFTFKRHHKGVHFDGHERADVVEARKEYIKFVTIVDERTVHGDLENVH
jgi:hypothetical protein